MACLALADINAHAVNGAISLNQTTDAVGYEELTADYGFVQQFMAKSRTAGAVGFRDKRVARLMDKTSEMLRWCTDLYITTTPKPCPDGSRVQALGANALGCSKPWLVSDATCDPSNASNLTAAQVTLCAKFLSDKAFAAMQQDQADREAKWNGIQNGMTLAEVRALLGADGSQVSSAGSGSFTLETYNFGGWIISFENGRVDAKARTP